MFDYIAKGGILIFPLILLSIFSFTIIIYKVFQFFNSGSFDKSFVNNIINLINNKKEDQAHKILDKEDSVMSRVIKNSIKISSDNDLPKDIKEAEIERFSGNEFSLLEKYQRGLELVAQISPLIGLLGTVIGMVKAFEKIAEAGSRVDPSILAEGIWEALITTVAGLIVAIPAFMAYYAIESYLDKARQSINDANVKISRLYARNRKIN